MCPSGNPVNASNGNKFESPLDLVVDHGGIEFRRMYNSNLRFTTHIGANWTGTYDRVVIATLSVGAAVVKRPNGRSYDFRLNGTVWESDSDVADKLEKLNSGTALWRYTNADDNSVELFDADGRLMSIKSQSGLGQVLDYSDGTSSGTYGTVVFGSTTALPAGLLIRVTDAFGKQIGFAYDSNRNIVRITDPTGGVYAYAYDSYGNLITITYPDTKVRSYLYNESAYTSGAFLPYALTGIVDENNMGNNSVRYATFQYFADGRAKSTEHFAGANKYSFAYSANASSVIDPLLSSRDYQFSTVLGVARNTSATAACTSWGSNNSKATTYDAGGNISSKADFNSNLTCTTYDLARNLETSRREGLGGPNCTTPTYKTESRKTETDWHALLRIPVAIREYSMAGGVQTHLRTTTYVYDGNNAAANPNGNITLKTVTDMVANKSRAWTYSGYDAYGRVGTINGPRDDATDAVDTTTYEYYPNTVAQNAVIANSRGMLKSVTNAAGHITTYNSYDANGRVLQMTDPNGLVTNMTYWPRGWLQTRTTPDGEGTGYTYDGVGQLTKVSLLDTSGTYIEYQYDNAHRLIKINDNLNANWIEYVLDNMGNRIEEKTIYVGSLAKKLKREIDALNRIKTETLLPVLPAAGMLDPAGDVTSYAYDNQGNLKTITDPKGRVTTNNYDALNRLIQMIDPLGAASVPVKATNYTYNALDQLTKITDPRGLDTNYNLDALGNLNALVSPDTGTTSNSAFDLSGNLKTSTDARGKTANYTYDGLNRIKTVAYAQNAALNVTYTYDSNVISTVEKCGAGRKGQVCKIEDSSGKTEYVYDLHGRVTEEKRTIGTKVFTVGYAYAKSRLSQMTYPGGMVVAPAYLTNGRIAGLTRTFGGITTAIVKNTDYFPFGPISYVQFGDNKVYSRTFDGVGRIKTYTLPGDTQTLTYSAAGEIEGIASSSAPTTNKVITYDAGSRLKDFTAASITKTYEYDLTGNRNKLTDNGVVSTFNIATNSNWLSSVAGANAVSFVPDLAGNLATKGANTFAHDERGRLASVTGPAGGPFTYTINALGQRVSKTGGGQTTYFGYDLQGKLIGEYNTAGAPIQETIWLYDLPVAVLK